MAAYIYIYETSKGSNRNNNVGEYKTKYSRTKNKQFFFRWAAETQNKTKSAGMNKVYSYCYC